VKHLDKFDFKLIEHLVDQGINPEWFHSDPICEPIAWRYDRIKEWLSRHKDVTDYVIVDDETPKLLDPAGFDEHLVVVDFEEGFTWAVHQKIKYGKWDQ
jgi:myo-inositol catabolism protein IolC